MKHTFIASRKELNAEINKLKPIVDMLACYKSIEAIAVRMLEEDNKIPPPSLYSKIYKTFATLHFSDEYLCRITISAAKEFIGLVDNKIKSLNLKYEVN